MSQERTPVERVGFEFGKAMRAMLDNAERRVRPIPDPFEMARIHQAVIDDIRRRDDFPRIG